MARHSRILPAEHLHLHGAGVGYKDSMVHNVLLRLDYGLSVEQPDEKRTPARERMLQALQALTTSELYHEIHIPP